MVVIRVITEKDGKTRKIKGGHSTTVTNVERRFATNTIYDVIANLQNIVKEDERLIAVHEEHPAISIL